jgi:hypothetical protein
VERNDPQIPSPERASAGQSPLLVLSKYRHFSSVVYLIALILVILILLGNTANKPILRQIFFLKIRLSNIIPRSVPNAALVNSIARTIGLRDFYQVGLWNFCEGYDGSTGISFCSTPTKMYYFNPVQIILDELLAGATGSSISRFLH